MLYHRCLRGATWIWSQWKDDITGAARGCQSVAWQSWVYQHLGYETLEHDRPDKWDKWFQIFFDFLPLPGEIIQFDEHNFQMGWLNHQLDDTFPKFNSE